MLEATEAISDPNERFYKPFKCASSKQRNHNSIMMAIIGRIRSDDWNRDIIFYTIINTGKKNVTPLVSIFANNHFCLSKFFILYSAITLSILDSKTIRNLYSFVIEYTVNAEVSSDFKISDNDKSNEFFWIVAIFILYLLVICIFCVYHDLTQHCNSVYYCIWNALL